MKNLKKYSKKFIKGAADALTSEESVLLGLSSALFTTMMTKSFKKGLNSYAIFMIFNAILIGASDVNDEITEDLLKED